MINARRSNAVRRLLPASLTRLGLVALVTVALAACASPQRFKGDVELFAAAVDNAAKAYDLQGQQVQAYVTEVEMRRLLRIRPALQDGPNFGDCRKIETSWQNKADAEWERSGGIDPDDYRTSAKALLETCQIYAEIDGKIDRIEIDAGDIRPEHTRLMQGLVAYARGLTALVDSAADRKAFGEAATGARDDFMELLAASRNVGRSIQGKGGPAKPLEIEEELTIISSLLIQAVGASLENKRREALAKMVSAMQPAVEEATNRLAAMMRFRHLTVLPRVMKAFRAAVDASTLEDVQHNERLYNDMLSRAVAIREAIAVAARIDPGAIFESMVAAHTAIGIAIRDPEARLGELAGSVQDFYDTTKRGLDAIKSLRAKLDGKIEP